MLRCRRLKTCRAGFCAACVYMGRPALSARMASVTFLKRIGVLSLVPATGQNVVGTANASQPGQPTELVRGEEFSLQTATAERGAVLIRRPVLYPAELRARMGGSVSVA